MKKTEEMDLNLRYKKAKRARERENIQMKCDYGSQFRQTSEQDVSDCSTPQN